MVKGKVVRARHFFCISSGLINVFVFVGLEVNENINQGYSQDQASVRVRVCFRSILLGLIGF